MITGNTAVQLDEIADELAKALAPSSDLDSRLYNLILEPSQVIYGLTPPTGFKYTLNMTNALQLRAKKWYLRSLMEIATTDDPYVVEVWFEFNSSPGFVTTGTGSSGQSLGLGMCAAIAKTWAVMVRSYLAQSS